MSDNELKKIYDSLKEAGDLHILFPNVEFTGEFSKDKNKFSKAYMDMNYLGSDEYFGEEEEYEEI